MLIKHKDTREYSELSKEYDKKRLERQMAKKQNVKEGQNPNKDSTWRKKDYEMSKIREAMLDRIHKIKRGNPLQ